MLGLTLATVLMSGATPASAQGGGGLQVSPIRLDLGAKQRGGALTLTNTSESKKTIQVDVVAWSQNGEEDVYTPSRELLANPPLFFLEPGASQVVRIGLAASAKASASERSYRVYLREVPQDKPVDAATLRVVVRLGVPVFVSPAAAIAPDLQWSGQLQKDGSVIVALENRGSKHVRVAQLKLLAATGGEVLGEDPSLHYLLAGSRQRWQIKPGAQKLTAGPARISALMEDGAREFPVVVQAD
ncbi:MAG TPA: fimbria/pilus periplasmic chaperone [Nevskiaceae bacterium]|nr:fimbria/pilus periplasmic chaperone [Nevskiaceae bacterium]